SVFTTGRTTIARSDIIDGGLTGIKIVAKSTENHPCVALGTTTKHKIVFDSGIQRFYSILLADENGTRDYIYNIVRSLAK
ncbi:MAG: hypothetical protein HQK54_09255, partial [Oligoflexales bacterium]|nr:hypothetical protein [Oligoflexales bacterium]